MQDGRASNTNDSKSVANILDCKAIVNCVAGLAGWSKHNGWRRRCTMKTLEAALAGGGAEPASRL